MSFSELMEAQNSHQSFTNYSIGKKILKRQMITSVFVSFHQREFDVIKMKGGSVMKVIQLFWQLHSAFYQFVHSTTH